MKEKVAVVTVEGKAYFLIVNLLKERNIPFLSLVPGNQVAAEVKVVITTEEEKHLITFTKILIFHGERQLDALVDEVERILRGKDAYEQITVGIDPGEAIGLAAIADGQAIKESNCFSPKEVIDIINKITKNVNFSVTNILVKIGSGVPVYKDLLEALDEALPPKVELEVVSEAGTNKPLEESKRSRGIRHISSAKRIAARTGHIFPRRKRIATNCRI